MSTNVAASRNQSPWWVALLAVGISSGCSRGEPEGASASTPSAPSAQATQSANAGGSARLSPEQVARTTAEETRRKVQAGDALLVCAYTDSGKYERNKLAGSISLEELERRAPSLALDQELIFYCA